MKNGVLLLLGGLTAWSSLAKANANVVSIGHYLKPGKCSSIFKLKEGTPIEAKVIDIHQHGIPFQFPDSFFSEMLDPRNKAIYFFSSTSGPAPVDAHIEGKWSSIPLLDSHASVYAIKAIRLPSYARLLLKLPYILDDPKDSTRPVSIDYLQQAYKIESYSKLPISPLFSLLQRTIMFARGSESYVTDSMYVSVKLNYDAIMKDGPLFERALSFVDSWVTIHGKESEIKAQLKVWIREGERRGASEDNLAPIAQQITTGLASFFDPAVVQYFVDDLATQTPASH